MTVTEEKLTQIILESINEYLGYHASGSDFDKFDHHHYLSTGCGSQVFGWGTYITDSIDVAYGYAQSLGTKRGGWKYRGNSIYKNGKCVSPEVEKWIADNNTNFDNDVKRRLCADICMAIIISFGNKNVALRDANDDLHNAPANPLMRQYLIAKLQILGQYIDWNELEEPPSYLYTVDIPEDNGSNYLYWYKNLSWKQLKQIIGYLYKSSPKFFGGNKKLKTLLMCLQSGTMSIQVEEVYQLLSKMLGSQKAASIFLKRLGYVGIKYPCGTRIKIKNAKGFNYVIFDENDVKITNKKQMS